LLLNIFLQLACDNIVSAVVVTATGKIAEATLEENSELLWALRGGGNGNFGVVVEITVQTYAVPAVSTFVTASWNNISQAATVIAEWELFLAG
jgi:FAD/FMN-containing dehydrogenase